MYTKAFLAALVGATAVSAHGYNPAPDVPGWAAQQQDLGFVAPDAAGQADIICHKSATPGKTSVKVAAGEKVTGSGTANPTGTAGTSLYTANDKGVLFDIYSGATSYPIPGPALYSSKKRRNHARDLFIVD
ncbi:hypothetical protein SGCOL_004245 [Colletotrichum sp. CLE4]